MLQLLRLFLSSPFSTFIFTFCISSASPTSSFFLSLLFPLPSKSQQDQRGMEANKSEMKTLVERNLLSEEQQRKLARDHVAKRLSWGYKPSSLEQLSSLVSFAKALKGAPLAPVPDESECFFYELPASALELFLGPNLKFGLCYFNDETTTLGEAEIAIFEMYCERAELKNGQKILDFGCGWGSLCFYLAKKYPNSQITGLTNATSQKNHIEAQCRTLGISNVDVVLVDATEFEAKSRFDRVLLIEVIEDFMNFEQLFKMISNWTKDDGLVFIEYFCHKAFAYSSEPIYENDWLSSYGFSIGMTVSALNLPLYFQDDLSVVDHWIISGKHPMRASKEWIKGVNENEGKMKSILESECGKSKEEAAKAISLMKFAMIVVNEHFSYNDGEEWMASHILFRKK